MASSLTTYAGSPVRGWLTSNSSTAMTPVTSSSPAMRSPASVARTARSSSRPGAGARTSVQMPSVCTVSTTGHAVACPDGLRAISTASSRTNSTRSSASRPPASRPSPAAASRATAASQSAASSADAMTRTPLPS